MDIQSAYNAWSETYDSDENLTRDLDHQVTRRVLGSQRFESILEIGCGTGKNTGFFAQIADHVRAVDFSSGMIEKAREKIQAKNVDFSILDITTPWNLGHQAFDLIVCNLVLEHVPDLDFIFSEAAQTLRLNGKFFINELHPFRQYDGKKARFYHDAREIKIEAFVHHLSDFFRAGANHGFTLSDLKEYWHERDQNALPRILSLLFARR